MKSSSTRRELRELLTLYKLKPHFRDIVVEGRDDAAWLKWYLSEHGAKNTMVFAVDDRVTIPREMVSEVHNDVNARGRVVALAVESEKWSLPQPSLTCVVDSDFELFEPDVTPVGLFKTDYAAMEVYALTDRPLSKFLVASAKSNIEASTLVAGLRPAWAVLYALRYVLHRHSGGARLTSRFAEKCINDAGEVVANVRELLRMVSPTPTQSALEELLALHGQYLNQIPGDTLQGIRGHDIAPMIIRFLRLKNDLADPAHVERLLKQSLELRDLDEEVLFRQLRDRVVY